MPWQQLVADVALEVDPITKRLIYRNVILTVPRQSGKTTLLLALILFWALRQPRQNIRYTAQTGSDARKKWMDDWLPTLSSSPFASQFRPRLTNGHEALIFKNGSHQGLVATTKKSGHGGSIDLAILDESFAHPDARLEQALSPAMITRPEPQLWVVSTAGTFEDSPYLWSKVEEGRQLATDGVSQGTAYFEWSADEDADPSDEAVWWACMPALGRTATVEAVRSEFSKPGELSEFRRAYLNQWVTALSDPVIPLERWAMLVDAQSEMLDPITFAFDVSPDRAHAAIAAAGTRHDGLDHLEVVDHRVGTNWVAHRLAELVAAHNPRAVLCDPAGPAGSLVLEIESRGVKVVPVSAKEHGQACGILYDRAMDGFIRHLGTPELVSALDGAVKRPLGDAWAWSRRSSSVDISPLVAVTLALWGSRSQVKPVTPRVVSLVDALAAAGS